LQYVFTGGAGADFVFTGSAGADFVKFAID